MIMASCACSDRVLHEQLILSVCRTVCFSFLILVWYLFLLSPGPLYLCGKLTSQLMLFLSCGSISGALLISVSGLYDDEDDDDDGGGDRWLFF